MAEESKMSELPATITSKYDALFTLFHNDPNFHKLPLPECVRAKFNIPLEVKDMPLQAAITTALTSRYEYSGYELRDQTGLDISFPPVPEKALPIISSEIKPLELEDHSNSLASQSAAECKTDESSQQPASVPQSDEEVK